MKTKFIRYKGRLAIGYTPKGAEKPFILAAATLHEGTGCWQIVDIRLTRFCVPSEYSCSLMADDITAVFSPRTTEEADIAKSMLREYREVPVTNNPSLPPRIVWCTFDGILRGHPSVGGYSPKRHFDFEQAGYFSYKEVLSKLAEIQSSWGDFTGDPRTFRLANPDRQPNLTEVIGKVVSKRILAASQGLAERPEFGTPAPRMPEHASEERGSCPVCENSDCPGCEIPDDEEIGRYIIGSYDERLESGLQAAIDRWHERNSNNECDDVDEEVRSHTP